MFGRARRQLPADAPRLFANHVAGWAWLAPGERERLVAATEELLRTRRWEASRGFDLTDEMCTVIAAQVALTCLGFDEGIAPLERLTNVIVHPRTITLTGTHHPAPGLESDEPRYLSGEAHDGRGPLLLAWDAVWRESRHPRRRRNVVIHEVAHKLDMIDGVLDGTPPLAEPDAVERWVTASTRTYRMLRRSGDDLIDDYGATNPAEFFAVVSELFFTAPADMAEVHPELYACYRDFYGQDPATRRPKPVSEA